VANNAESGHFFALSSGQIFKNMTVTIKTAEEQDKMRIAGRLASEVLDMIGDYVKSGISTEELNRICHRFITEDQDAIPAPLNYRGFPKSICTSVNHVVCHGIPGEKTLKTGDAVNIDITVIKDGFHGDTSRMFFVGKPKIQAQRLSQVAYDGMWLGIEELAPGKHLGDVGAAIQAHVEKHHYSVVREFCGHGIGRIFHEDPQVLHYGDKGAGMELKAGMTLTVEPMVNAGGPEVNILKDRWTVVTKDHSLSAQWEHTILITDSGYEVLTLGADAR
jgi:methionine aminopeptidase type I